MQDLSRIFPIYCAARTGASAAAFFYLNSFTLTRHLTFKSNNWFLPAIYYFTISSLLFPLSFFIFIFLIFASYWSYSFLEPQKRGEKVLKQQQKLRLTSVVRLKPRVLRDMRSQRTSKKSFGFLAHSLFRPSGTKTMASRFMQMPADATTPTKTR